MFCYTNLGKRALIHATCEHVGGVHAQTGEPMCYDAGVEDKLHGEWEDDSHQPAEAHKAVDMSVHVRVV